MSGSKNGLQSKIKSIAPKAVYIHCYAHQLNLALMSACYSIKCARNYLSIINKLHDFIEGSAKRHGLFKHIQEERHATTLKHLSDTRWASRFNSFFAIKETYSSILLFLEIIDDNEKSEIGATAFGLLTAIKQFDFIFFVHVMCSLFKITTILNSALQSKELHISGAIDIAEITILNLIQMKNTDNFENIFEEVEKIAVENNIAFQVRPRGRPKKRARNSNVLAEEELEDDLKQKYNLILISIIDSFISEIGNKFNT